MTPLSLRMSSGVPVGHYKEEVAELTFGLNTKVDQWIHLVDLVVDIETCGAQAENFLEKGKAVELFSEKQGEHLMGEDFLDHHHRPWHQFMV